jgi:spore germination cell wall hydrolase CwlJ-like protein
MFIPIRKRILTLLTILGTSCTPIKKNKIELICTDEYSTIGDYSSNLYHFAACINAECGICSDEEKYMVGSVILNRANGDILKIYNIVSAKRQFSGFKSPHYYPTEKTYSIALSLLKGENRIYDIYYFYNPILSTDTSFVNWASEQNLTQKEYHNYF